jgi:hypothetical protein
VWRYLHVPLTRYSSREFLGRTNLRTYWRELERLVGEAPWI